jgi:hypothetical protein
MVAGTGTTIATGSLTGKAKIVHGSEDASFREKDSRRGILTNEKEEIN